MSDESVPNNLNTRIAFTVVTAVQQVLVNLNIQERSQTSTSVLSTSASSISAFKIKKIEYFDSELDT